MLQKSNEVNAFTYLIYQECSILFQMFPGMTQRPGIPACDTWGESHETFRLVISWLCTMNLSENSEFSSYCLMKNRRYFSLLDFSLRMFDKLMFLTLHTW